MISNVIDTSTTLTIHNVAKASILSLSPVFLHEGKQDSVNKK